MIIDHFGHTFFHGKRILDLGCGHGDIGAAFYRLGAKVTCVDARNEHVKLAGKKYPGIQTQCVDLDKDWPFDEFDIILDLDLVCHLKNFEEHLRAVCNSGKIVCFETAICDSNDPNLCTTLTQNKSQYDWSMNGFSSIPTAAMVERIFTECGMDFKRFDLSKMNLAKTVYDWRVKNTGACDLNKRRFWIANKKTFPINAAKHPPETLLKILPKKNVLAANPYGLVSTLSPLPFIQNTKNRKFVVVIPSYKNEKWCEQNIQSALDQDYKDFRIIFTDDCSPDNTFNKVKMVVEASPNNSKTTLIKNSVRKGALENLYDMIHSCDDEEIILTLDGDDWFPDNQVLNKLNEYYSKQDIWMTYGQYQNHPDGGTGIAKQYPDGIVATNNFRGHEWCASHLRTFYAWLFKKIEKNHLCYNGEFFKMTWDFAIMFPMLEMAGNHSKFTPDILYKYNMENPINDHKVNVKLQQELDRHIRKLPKYKNCTRPIPKIPKVGLLLIATNKYDKFIQGMIASADKHFLKTCDVTYYVLTDSNIKVHSKRNIVYLPIDHRPFPYASMDRFKHFSNFSDHFRDENYLYYVDVDCMFVDDISEEILGDLVGVRHCGYYNNNKGPYENNPKSVLYTDPTRYKYYFGGGFSGGKKDNYLKLSNWCSDMIDKDISNGIIPVWHDETALNRYFLDNDPSIALTPSYHYPQSNIANYKKIWYPDTFRPKILLLDKIHKDIRA